jgi:hypothetical protein
MPVARGRQEQAIALRYFCWSYVSPIGINPGADGILTALEDLSKQEAAR